MRIQRHKHSRFWAVADRAGTLVAVCVYKRGASHVVRLLSRLDSPVRPHRCRTLAKRREERSQPL